jgi:hypothetical protein
MSKRYSRGKKARFICDRSGFEYPYSEGVIEPGTGLFVHKSESDGMWNLVDHPQNFSPKDLDDEKGLRNARPDGTEGQDLFIGTETDVEVILLTEGGGAIVIE